MDKKTEKSAEKQEMDNVTLKRNHEPTKSSNVDVNINKESSQTDSSQDDSGVTAATSPPRKKLVAALKEKLDEEKKMTNMALAHEIALNDNFKLPEPSQALNVNPDDKSPEANKKRMEKAVKEVVQKAFWDNVKMGIESDPPRYEHAFILLHEIKEILLSLLPANRVTTIHKRIEEVMDLELFQQQAANDTLNVRSVAEFIINTMASLCAPVRDDEINALRSVEDIVELFQKIYAVLDKMKIDLANFSIQTVRPHIQQKQFEYERSTFAKLVQKSPDSLKNTQDWIRETYEEMKTMPPFQNNATSSNGRPAIAPLLVLKAAYIKLLMWDFTKEEFPETLQMDKNRFQNLQHEVNRLTLVAAVMITGCGILGQPLSSHKAFITKLKEVLFTLISLDSMKNGKVEDLLENVSLQVWKEAVGYVEGKGPEVEKCVASEKEEVLKSKLASLSALESHSVYAILHTRILGFMRSVADSLASKNAGTTATLPSPPSVVSFITPELSDLALKYAKVVNLNQTVYGPFYVPILREIMDIPQSPTSPTSDPDATKSSTEMEARRKLDLSESASEGDPQKEDSKQCPNVTGSLSDLD